MRVGTLLHTTGAIVTFVGLFMLFPLAWALYYGEGDALPLFWSFLATTGSGALVWRLSPRPAEITVRESFAVVTFGWLGAALFGSLPFILSGSIPSFTDAFFETMSGFTTTGASILTDIESLPHGVLFWRSLTHWLGGMGIIVLSLAVLPMLGIGGMQLYKAEIPGPVAEKLAPRIGQTAKILWTVYALISALETLALLLAGMNLFDALCHTFGTMATGGFSTKNASIAHYGGLVQWIIILFMLIAGANFSLHYYALRGRFRNYWRSEEFRFYLLIMLVGTVVLAADNLATIHPNPIVGLRASIFQAVSITTTTGFVTADYEKWSASAQFILLLFMFIGGCAGSTGGSVKVLRVMVLFKQGLAEVRKLLHPRAVVPVRVDGQVVSPELSLNILGFTFLYLFLFSMASITMALLGLDLVSAIASVAATLGNVGPGLGSVGPTDNYAHVVPAGKWLLSFLMLLGRLEIYTVLVLFSRDFWRR